MRRTIWLLPLVAVIVPFFPLFLHTDLALFFRDLSLDFYPAKVFLWESFTAEGRFPLWYPTLGSGMSYLADITVSPLHPLNLALLAAPKSLLPWAFSLWIAAHYAIIATGTYLLLRRLGTTLMVAALFALSFSWCGPVLSASNLPHVLGGMAGGVWFFYFFYRNRQEPKALWAICAGACLSFAFLCGDPSQAYMLALLGALLTFGSSDRWRGIRFLAITGLACFLLSLPQLLATWEQMQLSTRSLGDGAHPLRYAWSLHPARLIEWLIPHYWGSIANNDFRGAALNDSPFPGFFIWDAHLGLLPLLTLIAGLGIRRFTLFREQKILATIAVLTLWLCMGDKAWLSIYKLAEWILPVWNQFRYPERFLLWPFLFFHLLAALALPENYWRKKYVLAIATVLLLLQGAYFSRFTLIFTPSAASFTEHNEAARKIQEHKEKEKESLRGGAAHRFYQLSPPPSRPGMSAAEMIESDWNALSENIPAAFGIHGASAYVSLPMAANTRFAELLKEKDPKRYMDLLSVKYLLSYSSGAPKVFLNESPMPRISSPASWIQTATVEDAWDRIVDAKNLLPILENNSSGRVSGEAATVRILREGSDDLSLELEKKSDQPSLLIWNSSFHPRWLAYVNDVPAKVFRLNTWAMAIELNPKRGTQRVNFRFDPTLFRYSLTGPLLVALFALLLCIRKRVRTSSP